MDPGLIVVLAICFAVLVVMFWRILAQLALVLVIVAVFIGIMTLANAGQTMFSG